MRSRLCSLDLGKANVWHAIDAPLRGAERNNAHQLAALDLHQQRGAGVVVHDVHRVLRRDPQPRRRDVQPLLPRLSCTCSSCTVFCELFSISDTTCA